MCNMTENILINMLSIYIIVTSVFLASFLTSEWDRRTEYRNKTTWIAVALFASLTWPAIYARTQLFMNRTLRSESQKDSAKNG